MDAAKFAKAHCPDCDGERSCDLHGHISTSWDYSDNVGNFINGGTAHNLLQCRGCEKVFYETRDWNSESIEHNYNQATESWETDSDITATTFPKPESKTKPGWVEAIGRIDEQLQQILNEMYVALDNQLNILTAIGLRTALDRGFEVLGIDPSFSFARKLQELEAKGFVGSSQRAILEVVADAGSAAVHRGWTPDAHELQVLVSSLEIFLQNAFIVGRMALGIKANIPARLGGKVLTVNEPTLLS